MYAILDFFLARQHIYGTQKQLGLAVQQSKQLHDPLPGQQCKLLLQHDFQLLTLFGNPVVHTMVAVTVLQHQPEVSNKLSDGLIFPVDKLLLDPLQAHRMPEL